MKKVIALALLLLLALSESTIAEDKKPIGRLMKLGVDEDKLNSDIAGYYTNVPFSGIKCFYDLGTMLSALQSGRIAAFAIGENTADYLISRTEDYAKFLPPEYSGVTLKYAMLLREDDTELCAKISSAITAMKADGTLEAMKKRYIDDCISGEDPEAVKPEHFDGAATLRVALTGDHPPMDYVSSSGKPIGFNTALVSEIAKRLKMNAEFISIDTGSRAISLESKLCDAIFWTEEGNYNNREGSDKEDVPEHAIATESYLGCKLMCVTLKSSPVLKK